MDECPVGNNGLKPKELKELLVATKLQDQIFLWIACQTQKSPPSEEIKSKGNYSGRRLIGSLWDLEKLIPISD